jgi:hypothetical protein
MVTTGLVVQWQTAWLPGTRPWVQSQHWRKKKMVSESCWKCTLWTKRPRFKSQLTIHQLCDHGQVSLPLWLLSLNCNKELIIIPASCCKKCVSAGLAVRAACDKQEVLHEFYNISFFLLTSFFLLAFARYKCHAPYGLWAVTKYTEGGPFHPLAQRMHWNSRGEEDFLLCLGPHQSVAFTSTLVLILTYF